MEEIYSVLLLVVKNKRYALSRVWTVDTGPYQMYINTDVIYRMRSVYIYSEEMGS
jgi:hypothetical protein